MSITFDGMIRAIVRQEIERALGVRAPAARADHETPLVARFLGTLPPGEIGARELYEAFRQANPQAALGWSRGRFGRAVRATGLATKRHGRKGDLWLLGAAEGGVVRVAEPVTGGEEVRGG